MNIPRLRRQTCERNRDGLAACDGLANKSVVHTLPRDALHVKPRTRRRARSPRARSSWSSSTLSNDQIDALLGYAVAQGEESDTYDVGHPGVDVTSDVVGRGKHKKLVVKYAIEGLSDD